MKLLSFVNRPWKVIVIALVALAIYFPSTYIVPDTYLVEIISTEVKRTGKSSGTDVYRVRTRRIEDGEPGKIFVMRNEDIMLYLKWDSADVQAEFDALSKAPGNRVRVRFYGWRIQILSLFPNVLSVVEIVDPGMVGESAK